MSSVPSATLPQPGLISRLRSRPALMRVLTNSSWLMGEQFLRLVVGFGLGVWTARHLGPADFGLLSYAIAYTGIFAVVATLGLNRILVRELVAAQQDEGRTVGLLATALTLRMTAAGALYLAAIAGAWYSNDGTVLITALVAGGTIFSAADCVELYFQSRVESRHSARARLMAFVIGSVARLGLLIMAAPVMAFALLTLVEGLLALAVLLGTYRRHGPRLHRAAVSLQHAKTLLRESAPEIVAGLGGILFMRLDQVMLHHMQGAAAVGTFAVAARLTELWYFIPVALVASAFPGIVAIRETDRGAYLKRIESLTAGLVMLAYGVCIFTTLVVAPLVPVLFGAAYAEATHVLVIQVWCGVFLVLAQTSGAWLMAERMARQNMYRSLVGLSVNISANLMLIPAYGAAGAAAGTLLSFAAAYLLYDLLSPSIRPMALIKLRALLLYPLFARMLRRPHGSTEAP